MILILTRSDLIEPAAAKPIKAVGLADVRGGHLRAGAAAEAVAAADAVLFVERGRARVLKSRTTEAPSAVLELGSAIRLALWDPSTGTTAEG